jgi:hypothetical protein
MKANSAQLNRGNFLTELSNLMVSLGVRRRPAGLDTSISPHRIIYDNSSAQKLRTLVDVPHIGEPSQVRDALWAPVKKGISSEHQDMNTLTGSLVEVQSLANEVNHTVDRLRGSEPSIDAMANLHIEAIEKDAKAAGVTLFHEFDERLGWFVHQLPRILVDKGLPLPSAARAFKEDTWKHYFKAALFRSAVGGTKNIIRAVAELEWAAQTIGSEPAQSLITELAAALCLTIDDGSETSDYADTFFETYSDAVSGWNVLLANDDYRNDRVAIIAQGIENCFPRRRYYAAKPFLNASINQYGESNLNCIAAADHLRLAWSVVASAVEMDVDEDTDWYNIEDSLDDAVTLAEKLFVPNSQVEALKQFREAAERIGTELG